MMKDETEMSFRTSEPLAARMRPRTLEEVVGQRHVLGLQRASGGRGNRGEQRQHDGHDGVVIGKGAVVGSADSEEILLVAQDVKGVE